MISIVFERHGINTRVAEDGREAMTLLTRKGCDYCAVFLDLDMPPPNGIEVARFIRDTCPQLPVIVISGHADLTERIRREDLGSAVRMILKKPFDASLLVTVVHPEMCSRETSAEAR